MPAKPYHLLHQNLQNWYQLNGRRTLPWRNTSDPYWIYVSEMMLQQTQVKTVLERFYIPFLEKFPSLEVLSMAAEQEVLKAWEGLGYYSRARYLHQSAKLSSPSLPDQFEDLIKLPGIGKNTAHALLAFAFKKPVPVMEANVKRVLSRFFALTHPTSAQLWDKAYELLNKNDPYDYNQAMMDIGAMICTNQQVLCQECPLAIECKGKENPKLYSAKLIKKTTPIRKRHIIIWYDGETRYLLAKRQTRFLNGLYGFLQYEALPQKLTSSIGEVTQIYSHFKLQGKIYKQLLTNQKEDGEGEWFDIQQIRQLPLSEVDRKIIEHYVEIE